MDIRRIQYSEYMDQINLLITMHYHELYKDIPGTVKEVKVNSEVLLMMEQEGCLLGIGLFSNDQLVGYLGLLQDEHYLLNKDHIILQELGLYILPEHRGTGMSVIKMLKLAEKVSKDAGVQSMTLISPAANDCRNLYERLGYKELETTYIKSLE